MAKKTYPGAIRHFRFPWIPPASFLGSRQLMDSLRGVIAYTHMGSFSIIKQYYTAQYLHTLPDILYLHFIKPFGLKYAIGTFGDRILQWITALRHADLDAINGSMALSANS